jgi:hypothetical protein
MSRVPPRPFWATRSSSDCVGSPISALVSCSVARAPVVGEQVERRAGRPLQRRLRHRDVERVEHRVVVDQRVSRPLRVEVACLGAHPDAIGLARHGLPDREEVAAGRRPEVAFDRRAVERLLQVGERVDRSSDDGADADVGQEAPRADCAVVAAQHAVARRRLAADARVQPVRQVPRLGVERVQAVLVVLAAEEVRVVLLAHDRAIVPVPVP